MPKIYSWQENKIKETGCFKSPCARVGSKLLVLDGSTVDDERSNLSSTEC